MQAPPKIGDLFDDKFELLEILGSGGIGTVFKARQLDCDRIIALKVLHPQIASSSEIKNRFLREAKTLSRLQDSGIVTVYHLGISYTELPYMAMEFIEGKSIRKLLSEREKLGVLEALSYARDAANILAVVHEEGVIHRDIKPDNIIIAAELEKSKQGSSASTGLKIIDFGLVHLSEKNQKLTATNEVIGTLNYMSPEQCSGNDLSPATDIYSLSACLYEMLCGKKLFTAENAMSLMYKQLNSPPPPLKERELDLYHPALQQLLQTGLNKEPEKRFKSMKEFASKIDKCIEVLEEQKAGAHSSKKLSSPWILVSTALLLAFLFAAKANFKPTQNPAIQNKQPDWQLRAQRKDDLQLLNEKIQNTEDKLQKKLLYHKASMLILTDSKTLLPAKARLKILSAYSRCLDSESLPASAQRIRDRVLAEAEIKGLDRRSFSDTFNHDELAAVQKDSILCLSKFGKTGEAESLLNHAAKELPRDFLILMPAAITMHNRKLCQQLVNMISNRAEAARAADFLKGEKDSSMLEHCIATGETFSVPQELTERNQNYFRLSFILSKAYLKLRKKESKEAVSLIQTAGIDKLELDPDKKEKLQKYAISLLSLLKQYDLAESFIERLDSSEKPLPQQALVKARSSKQKIQLYIEESEKTKSECIRVLYAAKAYEEVQKSRTERIPIQLRLKAMMQYALALNYTDLSSASNEILKKIISESETHRAEIGYRTEFFNSNELLYCRALATRIQAGWGEFDSAKKTMGNLPEQFDFFTPWRDLLETELILEKIDDAKRVLVACPRSADFFHLAKCCLTHHQYELADICLAKCKKELLQDSKAILQNESPENKKRNLSLRATAAIIALDQERPKEARLILEPLFADSGSMPLELSNSLVFEAALSGFDVEAYLRTSRKNK